MQNGSTTADLKGQLAQAAEADNELVWLVIVDGIPHEVWKAGAVLLLVLAPPDKGPARIRTLIEDRREAMLSGVCPACGGFAGDHEVLTESVNAATLQHEDGCLVEEEAMANLIRRSYGKPKRNWWSRKVWDAAS